MVQQGMRNRVSGVEVISSRDGDRVEHAWREITTIRERRALYQSQTMQEQRAMQERDVVQEQRAAVDRQVAADAVAAEAALAAKVEAKLARAAAKEPTSWTFLSNYSHVLLLIAASPGTRMRDLAEKVGITERAIHRIVDDLTVAGYLKVYKTGRRNRYEVQVEMHLRHAAEAHRSVGELVQFVQMVEGK